MATAKKAASSKVTKKAAPKKSVAKKAAPSKTVKKATVKKAAVKKATVKKTAVKKVAAIKTSTTTTSTRSTSTVRPKPAVVLPQQVSATASSSYAPASEPKKSNRGFIIICLLFVIAAYFVISSKDSNKTAAPEPTPSPTLSMIQSPTPTAEPSEPAAPAATVNLSFDFTSTGSDITWRSSVSASSFELKIQASESKEARLVSFTGTQKSYSIDKIDTVGSTTFVITATLSDGSTITSKPLKLSGQY